MRCQLLSLLVTAAPLAALANVDYGNPSIEVILSKADLQAGTGEPDFSLRHIGMDEDGHLLVISRLASATGLHRVNVSVDPPTYELLASQADMIAATGESLPYLETNGIEATSGGIIYLSQFEGINTILRIDPSDLVTPVTKLADVAGIGGIRLSADESRIMVGQVFNFGAPANQFTAVDLGTAAQTVVATAGDMATAVGSTGGNYSPFIVDLAGNYIAFHEASFGGIDGLVQINDGDYSISVLVGAGEFTDPVPIGAGAAPGIESMVIDGYGAIYAWDRFAGSGQGRTLLIRRPDGTFIRYPTSAFTDVTGNIGGTDPVRLSSMQVYTDLVGEEVYLYAADQATNSILRLTFPTAPPEPTSADQWEVYE